MLVNSRQFWYILKLLQRGCCLNNSRLMRKCLAPLNDDFCEKVMPIVIMSFSLVLQIVCRLIAILLQYFYTSAFAWVFVESLHFYRMITSILDINRGPMHFYYAAGYSKYHTQLQCMTIFIIIHNSHHLHIHYDHCVQLYHLIDILLTLKLKFYNCSNKHLTAFLKFS